MMGNDSDVCCWYDMDSCVGPCVLSQIMTSMIVRGYRVEFRV